MRAFSIPLHVREKFRRVDRALANPKIWLEAVAQAHGQLQPEYRKVGVSSPDDRRLWICEVIWDGENVERGDGVSKRDAQRQAARHAIVRLGLVPEG